jgi:acetoin:2,6-dichlorophenolindophenol oxidoreductase subunit alpha
VPKEESELWQTTRDPIAMFEARLLEEGVLDPARIEQLRAGTRARVEAAVDFARRSPDTSP